MIFSKNNYDDVFLRDLTICVLSTFEEKISWTNRFKENDVKVVVPIYYSMSGSEDFLLDSFSDDVVSNIRKVELNTDIIPRGHITLNSWTVKSDEFCNPNVWMKVILEKEDEITKELMRVRAMPIKANYTCSIRLESEIDVFKCSQAIINNLMFYKYMYFEHNYIHIDAILQMPNDKSVTIQRDKNFTSDNTIRIDFDFEVDTYYPSYNENQLIGKPKGVRWANQINSSKKQK
jgi:hypothetical protein